MGIIEAVRRRIYRHGTHHSSTISPANHTTPHFDLSPLHSHISRTTPNTTTNNNEREINATGMWGWQVVDLT
jgi:hypothetical protein